VAWVIYKIKSMKKKKKLKSIILVFIVLGMVGFSKLSNKDSVSSIHTSLQPITEIPTTTADILDVKPTLTKYKSRTKFLNKIGHSESTNNYDAVSAYGYLGRYQFGISTLRALDYDGTVEEFLSSPELQDKYMLKYLRHNKKILHKIIEEYNGTIHNGKLITTSGILAASHLAGVGSVMKYFAENRDFADAYGTRISDYLHKFSGYKLNL